MLLILLLLMCVVHAALAHALDASDAAGMLMLSQLL
jgi:hypothetical protein